MSYDVDELFCFRRFGDGYDLDDYLKQDDPSVTELEIPAEYNGRPVARITNSALSRAEYIKRVTIPGSVRKILSSAFEKCSSLKEVVFSEGLELISSCAFANTALKSVRLPKSLDALYWGAFEFCGELTHVEFNSAPQIELNVFSGCPKLPPETVVMGLVRSFDITKPIFNNNDLLRMTSKTFSKYFDCFRPDVFELLAKNNCFVNCDLKHLFKRMTEENKTELFPIAGENGLIKTTELLDMLLSYATENQITESTAYLLELKKRKFGFDDFNGGDKFDI